MYYYRRYASLVIALRAIITAIRQPTSPAEDMRPMVDTSHDIASKLQLTVQGFKVVTRGF